MDLLGDFPSFAILHSANLSQCNKESCPLEREELLLNILATLSNVSFDPEAAELLQRGQAERIVRVCLEVLMEVQSQEELVLESLRVLCNVSRRSPSAREALQETHGQEALVLLVAHGVSHEVVEYASRVLVNVGLSTQLFSLLERHVEG